MSFEQNIKEIMSKAQQTTQEKPKNKKQSLATMGPNQTKQTKQNKA